MQGMPNKITDQDLYNALLSEHKMMAGMLVHAVLETGHKALRQDFQQSLTNILDHQYQIWQQMNQKGFYKPLQASQQEISQVQQEAQQLSQQLPGTWQAGAQAQGQAALPPNWPQPNVT